MTESKSSHDLSASEEEKPAPLAAEEGAQAPAGEADLSVEKALEAAQAEAREMKDQLLRAMAEVENTRRRTKKEIEDAHKFGVTNFAKEMLAVADNFSRALEAAPKDAADPAFKNLVTGIEAVERQLAAIFERFGIRKIDPMDQPFDPHRHRVMMEMEDLSKPAGTVIQVFQPGYMIHDRLLREAQVVVAKGGAPAHKVDTSA